MFNNNVEVREKISTLDTKITNKTIRSLFLAFVKLHAPQSFSSSSNGNERISKH